MLVPAAMSRAVLFVFLIACGAPVEEAVRLMVPARISALPVVQDTRLVGIVTETDLLRLLSDVLRTGAATGTRSSAVAPNKP